MKLWFAFVFGIAGLGFLPAQAAERVALVIGNGAYQNGSVLINPVNDAQLLANALQAAQFEVTLAKDAGLADMEKAVINFRRSAEGAKAAWFFYAGHGIEVKGSNFLVPVDAQVAEEFEVKHKTLALDLVLSALDEAGTPLKVVVLDCCRNNPFGRSWSRSGSAGLSQVTNTPSGTIIAFAAAPGNVALDGAGANSPYTTALAQALALPGKEIDQVFKETGRLVLAATDKKQQPWINSSFYDTFIPCPGEPGSTPPTYTPPVVTTPTMPTPPTVTYTPPANVPAPPAMTPAYPTAPARVLKPLVLPLDRGQKLQAETVTLNPITWKAGRWPERMALVGTELWLAESGQRTLACFDILSGALKDRVTCGRLPVYLTVANNEVYSAICTDNIIWKQRPMGGGGGQYADTGGDYTVAITSSPDAVFALLNIGGSSENSVVMRMDLRSGQITRSGKLGSNATDLAFAGGNLWLLANPYVDNAANAVLTRMDPYSMATYESYPHYEYGRMLAASGNLLFLGSGGEEGGSVASFDATTGQAVGYSDPTGKPISCVAAWDRFVVASDTGGTTYVLLANNMRTQRIINLSHGAFEPRHLVASGDALYLSAFQGEEGAIYKVPAWQPDGEVAEDLYTRLLKTESLNGVKINMAESEVVRLLGQPESVTPETLNEAFGLYFTDYMYQGGRMVVTLSTETPGGPKTVVVARAEAGANVSTFGGIMMGDGLNELRTVYAEYEDRQESPVPNPPTNESYNYVVGSIYGGVILQVTNGKVDHMILGAGAE